MRRTSPGLDGMWQWEWTSLFRTARQDLCSGSTGWVNKQMKAWTDYRQWCAGNPALWRKRKTLMLSNCWFMGNTYSHHGQSHATDMASLTTESGEEVHISYWPASVSRLQPPADGTAIHMCLWDEGAYKWMNEQTIQFQDKDQYGQRHRDLRSLCLVNG